MRPCASFRGQTPQRRRGAIGSFRLPRIPQKTKKSIRRWCSLYMLRLAIPALFSSIVPYMRSRSCFLPPARSSTKVLVSVMHASALRTRLADKCIAFGRVLRKKERQKSPQGILSTHAHVALKYRGDTKTTNDTG